MTETTTAETHSFQAEVSRLLEIVAHSLYSERRVFLRELVSNAADACDRLRYEALQVPELLGAEAELKIVLAADAAAHTLTISDNGIGMSRAELVGNLGTLAINPNLRKVPYDPLRDFAPIIQTTASSTVLVVHPSLPVKNVRELVALAKTRSLNYGASSSATFLPMELLKQMAKVDMTHIPYKGTGPSITGILSGEVQVMFGGSINTTPQVKNGKLRALAVAGDRRAKALPDVPTVAESGFPGYEANTWNGMLAPAGTPRAIVMRLNQEMLKILGTREVIEYMTADGAEPAGNTPDHFAAYIRSEHAKWAKVIKDAKISQSN